MTEPSTSDDAVETPEVPASTPAAEDTAAPEAEAPEDTAAPEADSDEADAPEDSAQDDSAEAEPSSDEDPAERVRALEEEGDIAADYLEELLDIADLDGDIDIDVDGDRASVEIRGADRLAQLNGSRGELLDALQELARLAVQSRTGAIARA
jgi:spoIIIJ-associated protein